MDERKIQTLDDAIIKASKKINVLKALAWPAGEEEKFLDGWSKGHPKLPTVNPEPPDLTANVQTLREIMDACDQTDPVEKFLHETALSYYNAAHMLMSLGTRDFTLYSTKIYGRPDTPYKTQDITAVDGARFLLDVTDKLLGASHVQSTTFDIPANDFCDWLRAEVDEFFEHDVVEVILDPNISSKALAGATRIRVRGSAMFSSLDKDQLLFHEAYIHTATQLNGKKQTNLKCLGLAAPRTTRTQEGLAVLAELITNSMDIVRLRRIALRVLAIKMALDGADFIDLFNFFLNAGQPPEESVRSAQRIFRSGAVNGGIVFTKDAMYLQGALELHTFLRVAIRDNRSDLIKNLFAGRLTAGDALRLSPLFESGWLLPPTYMPSWAGDLRRLTASLAYSAFIANIKLEKLYLERAIEFEEEMKQHSETLTATKV